jgi:hypothetical protein
MLVRDADSKFRPRRLAHLLGSHRNSPHNVLSEFSGVAEDERVIYGYANSKWRNLSA